MVNLCGVSWPVTHCALALSRAWAVFRWLLWEQVSLWQPSRLDEGKCLLTRHSQCFLSALREERSTHQSAHYIPLTCAPQGGLCTRGDKIFVSQISSSQTLSAVFTLLFTSVAIFQFPFIASKFLSAASHLRKRGGMRGNRIKATRFQMNVTLFPLKRYYAGVIALWCLRVCSYTDTVMFCPVNKSAQLPTPAQSFHYLFHYWCPPTRQSRMWNITWYIFSF